MTPKKRVLCVDDDPDTCEMLTALLGREYDVTATVSVADATRRHRESPFDLYILDGQCDDGGGVDLCRHVRESAPAVPVVIYSGHVLPEQMEEAARSGVTEYVPKPRINLLVETIRRLLAGM